MKVRNKTTGRFYMGFNSKVSQPMWSPAFKAGHALKLSRDDAERVVRQLCAVEPALDLEIVE